MLPLALITAITKIGKKSEIIMHRSNKPTTTIFACTVYCAPDSLSRIVQKNFPLSRWKTTRRICKLYAPRVSNNSYCCFENDTPLRVRCLNYSFTSKFQSSTYSIKFYEFFEFQLIYSLFFLKLYEA